MRNATGTDREALPAGDQFRWRCGVCGTRWPAHNNDLGLDVSQCPHATCHAALRAAEAKLAEVGRERREWQHAAHVAGELREAAESREKALREALADARAALNRDRTGLAAALNQIETEIKGWRWLRPEGDGDEGGTWGSHPFQAHTQATLRQEIAWVFNAILKIAADALRASGKLADEGCRQASAALAAGKETDHG